MTVGQSSMHLYYKPRPDIYNFCTSQCSDQNGTLILLILSFHSKRGSNMRFIIRFVINIRCSNKKNVVTYRVATCIHLSYIQPCMNFGSLNVRSYRYSFFCLMKLYTYTQLQMFETCRIHGNEFNGTPMCSNNTLYIHVHHGLSSHVLSNRVVEIYWYRYLTTRQCIEDESGFPQVCSCILD